MTQGLNSSSNSVRSHPVHFFSVGARLLGLLGLLRGVLGPLSELIESAGRVGLGLGLLALGLGLVRVNGRVARLRGAPEHSAVAWRAACGAEQRAPLLSLALSASLARFSVLPTRVRAWGHL